MKFPLFFWTGGCRLCLCMAVLLLAARAVGEEEIDEHRIIISKASVGIGGKHKVGHWTPVKFALDTTREVAGRFVLTTIDSEGLTTRFSDPQDLVLPASKSQHERLVQFGHSGAPLTIDFIPKEGAPARRTLTDEELSPGLTSTSELIVMLGPNIGLRQALAQRVYRNKRTFQVVELASLDELPTQPLGLDGVDLVVLSTSEQKWSQAPQAQTGALRDWLLLGGRAVITCGSQGEALFGQRGPFQSLAPGEFDRIAPLRRTAALETYAGSQERLKATGKSADVTLFQSPRGQIDLSESAGAGTEQPLIIRYPVGFGQITLITVDFDREPLNWTGRSKILTRVLAFHQSGETGKGNDAQQSLPAQLGYQDLAGQLRMALDQFRGVQLVAFSWVAALIGGYILIIGPLDYVLVRYGLKRMQATWFTLGATTIAFVALAWWLDGRLKSSEAQTNTADIIDVDLSTGIWRGTSWTHVYTPHTGTFEIYPTFSRPLFHPDAKLAPLATQYATQTSWEGLPGEGLGGLDGRAPTNLFDSPYNVSGGGIKGVPVQATSTKGFVASWWRSTLTSGGALEATSDGLISGKFTYDLDLELTDASIYFENWYFRIQGPMKRGRVIVIDELGAPRNLLWKLTEKQVIDAKDIITPYDPRTTDLRRILEIMMFHEAAGGDSYTLLTQRFQPRIDLSDHLRTGRAILVGRAERSPLAWQGESLADAKPDQAITMVRVVIPVSPP